MINQDIINAAVAKMEPNEVAELQKMIQAFNDYKDEVSNLVDLADGYEAIAIKANKQIQNIKTLASLETVGNPFESTETYKYIQGL